MSELTGKKGLIGIANGHTRAYGGARHRPRYVYCTDADL